MHLIFKQTRKSFFGAGEISKVVEEIKLLGAEKLLIVTDHGIVQAGLLERLIKLNFFDYFAYFPCPKKDFRVCLKINCIHWYLQNRTFFTLITR